MKNRQSTMYFLSVALITLIITLVVLSLFTGGEEVAPPQEPPVTQQDINSFTLVPVENPNQISIAGQTKTLPEGYIVSTIILIKENSKFICKDIEQESCRIYYILNTEDEITTYFISPTAEIKLSQRLGEKVEPVELSLKDTAYQLMQELQYEYTEEQLMADTFNPETVEPHNSFPVQIYGCLTEKFCVTSGYIQPDNNAERVEDFKKFIENLL